MKTEIKSTILYSAVIALAWLALPAARASNPVFTFTNLNSFYLSENGSDPEAPLVQGGNGNYYGTTVSGGAGGEGAIFEISSGGTFTLLHSFTGADGAAPRGGLVVGPAGNLYGTTSAGGPSGGGTVFEITPGGVLTTLHAFSIKNIGGNGSSPYAGLVFAKDGNFYGTTLTGGTSNYGTVFRITTNGTLTNLYSFADGTDGANPRSLIQASDGNLYGTTSPFRISSVAAPDGVLFKIATNGTFTPLHVFSGTDGANPIGALVQNPTTGVLYGTTQYGGTNGSGSIFQTTTNGTFQSLWSFVSPGGEFPESALVYGSGGILYGTTFNGGGGAPEGSIYSYLPGTPPRAIYTFVGAENSGANPVAALVVGNDGDLYGTASQGGSGGGTIFKTGQGPGTFDLLYEFPQTNLVLYSSALIHGSDGNFYGVSQYGGDYGSGNIFAVSSNGAISSLYSFTGGNDGATPVGALVQAVDGSFYGTTSQGGFYGNGTVFNISPGGLTTLYQFTGGFDGANPNGALTLGSDGNLYGTTSGEFFTGVGTIFKISTNGDLSTLYTFTNGIDGNGTGGLTLGDDGNFYGVTYDGGTNYMGAFFVMDSTGNLNVLYSFADGEDGANPGATLTLGGDGNFYGSTTAGGDYGAGTIFQMTPGASWTTLYSFQGEFDGYSPSQLLAGTDGNFYGTTPFGGVDQDGSVFEMTADGAFNPLYMFTGGSDGGSPNSGLVQGSDGSLYGTTSSGAGGNNGGVFRISGSTLPSPLPKIIGQPENASMTLTGLFADFTVEAVGGAPLFYQWRQNGVALPVDGDFSGTDLPTLIVDPASPGDVGTYSVVVSNSYGAVTSSNAVLALLPDTNALEYFEAGSNYLAVGDYILASYSFSNALSFSPKNPAYNFFAAASELLSLMQEPAGSNFLTHIGIGTEGRELFDWTATGPTNANGHLEVPATSPPLNADEFTSQLRTNVLPAVNIAEGDLSQITATNFLLDLPNALTHAGAVTVDWGDIQMLESMCYAGDLVIYTMNSWNMNAQLAQVTNLFDSPNGIQGILATYPGLLTTTSTADYPAAKAAFVSAIDSYFAASEFIRSRPPGEIRLFNLDPAKALSEFQFRQTLSNVLASLNGPVPLTINPRYSVSAAAFFNNAPGPRSFLPEYQGDEFVWNTFPDTDLGGVFLGLTETDLGKFLLKRSPADLDTTGTALSVLYDFTNLNFPTGLVQTPDGTLYGTFQAGGPYTDDDVIFGVGYGTVFKITPSGQLSTVYAFGSKVLPVTNTIGGKTGPIQVVYDFPADGAYPNALVLGRDGSLYGTTQSGGVSYDTNAGIVTTNLTSGTVFKVTTNGQLTTLHSFGAVADGEASLPYAALVQGTDNRFYGTTEFGGGTNGAGTIFAVSSSGNFSLLNWFTNDTNGNFPLGAYPAAPLVQGTDGNLYGTTAFGGITGTNTVSGGKGGGTFTYYTTGYGTIYKLTTASQLSSLYTFGTQLDVNGNPLDGAAPNGLIQGPNGVLYGTTEYGGTNDDDIGLFGELIVPGQGNGDGTLFSISPSIPNSFATLVAFDEGFADGFNPIGSLVPGPGGTFLGVASQGGGDRKGAVFIFNPGDETATNIVWLNKSTGDYSDNLLFSVFSIGFADGTAVNPLPSFLTAGSDGNFYGTTTDGGTNGDGTVYLLSLGSEFGAPVIQSAVLNNGMVNITWSTTPGGAYQLQFTAKLGGLWSNVGGVLNASGASLSAEAPANGTMGFYRVVQIK